MATNENHIRCFKSGELCNVTSDLDHAKLFVLMPFNSDFEEIYQEGIKKAADDLGLMGIRAKDIRHSQDAICMICQQIQSSQYVLADLTGTNSNVFYELGLAHGFGKDVILISQNTDELPFDLQIMNTLEYQNAGDLQHQLKIFMQERYGLADKKKGPHEAIWKGMLAQYEHHEKIPVWGDLRTHYTQRNEIPVTEDLCKVLFCHLLHDMPALEAKEWLKEIASMDRQFFLQVFNEKAVKRGHHTLDLLASVGEIESLLQILQDFDEELVLRRDAANFLGKVGDSRIIKPFLQILQDPNEDLALRRGVVETLGNVGDSRIVEPLLKILRDDDEDLVLRCGVVKALGDIGHSRAVKPLLKILQDKQAKDTLRSSVITALKTIGDTQAVPSLRNIIEDANESFVIVSEAKEALKKINEKSSV